MDQQYNLQDVLRCCLCEIQVPGLYCDICNTPLCSICVEKHLLDESNEHKIVLFKTRTFNQSLPKCTEHTRKQCELYCKNCDIPICVACTCSEEHQGHFFEEVSQSFEFQKKTLQKDLLELERTIFPIYKELASKIQDLKSELRTNSLRLKTSLREQQEYLQGIIDTITKKLDSEITEMDSKCMTILDKEEDEISQKLSNITEIIADLTQILSSEDVRLVSAYKSRIPEFRTVPPNLRISFPRFTPEIFNVEDIYEKFGFLSKLSIKKEEQSYSVGFAGDNSPFIVNPKIEVPRIITQIKTAYGHSNALRSVSCLNDEVWVTGNDNFLRLYNLHGELMKSITTKSGNRPWDIAVTKRGSLVYTDPRDYSVNIVNDAQIQTLFRLSGWKPFYVCCTSSGDLLIVMDTEDYKYAKVVRYSGTTAKQIIQFDHKGDRFYSSGEFRLIKYIAENRNFDICVADSWSRSIVVVNQAGELRFKYTEPLPSSLNKTFRPRGIATDSHSRILIADNSNDCIHIIDQDGQFVRFIIICALDRPHDVCVDTSDNLYVTERESGKLKKIQYDTSTD